MKNSAKKFISTGFIFLIAFAVFTILVHTVDQQTIPSINKKVGFATINVWFHNLTGVNFALYNITDWLSIVPLAVCLIHGLAGFTQLITRKNIFRVDSYILISGVYYATVVLFFMLFEIFPVNYRPILINGACEASYPSSTTLLVLTVMPAFIFNLRMKSSNRTIRILTAIFTFFMLIARLFSGVHWLTDIVGGILLSAGLFYIYKGAILIYDNKQTP